MHQAPKLCAATGPFREEQAVEFGGLQLAVRVGVGESEELSPVAGAKTQR